MIEKIPNAINAGTAPDPYKNATVRTIAKPDAQPTMQIPALPNVVKTTHEQYQGIASSDTGFLRSASLKYQRLLGETQQTEQDVARLDYAIWMSDRAGVSVDHAFHHAEDVQKRLFDYADNISVYDGWKYFNEYMKKTNFEEKVLDKIDARFEGLYNSNLSSEEKEAGYEELRQEYLKAMAEFPSFKHAESWVPTSWLEGVASTVPYMTKIATAAAAGAAFMGLGAMALGSFGTLSPIALAATPMLAATAKFTTFGAAAGGYVMSKQLIQNQHTISRLMWEDDQGNHLDPRIVYWSRHLSSALSAGTEMWAASAVLGNIGKLLFGNTLESVISTSLWKRAMQGGLLYAKGVGVESFEEGLQKVTEDVTDNLAKWVDSKLHGTNWDYVGFKDILKNAAGDFLQSIPTMMTLGLLPFAGSTAVSMATAKSDARTDARVYFDTESGVTISAGSIINPISEYDKEAVGKRIDTASKGRQKLAPIKVVPVGQSLTGRQLYRVVEGMDTYQALYERGVQNMQVEVQQRSDYTQQLEEENYAAFGDHVNSLAAAVGGRVDIQGGRAYIITDDAQKAFLKQPESTLAFEDNTSIPGTSGRYSVDLELDVAGQSGKVIAGSEGTWAADRLVGSFVDSAINELEAQDVNTKPILSVMSAIYRETRAMDAAQAADHITKASPRLMRQLEKLAPEQQDLPSVQQLRKALSSPFDASTLTSAEPTASAETAKKPSYEMTPEEFAEAAEKEGGVEDLVAERTLKARQENAQQDWEKAADAPVSDKAERHAEAMQRIVDAIDAKVGTKTQVVAEADNLPAAVKQAAIELGLGPMDVRAAYHNGSVYIVAEASSADTIEATYAHEWVAHRGLRQLLGEDFDHELTVLYDRIGEKRIRSVVPASVQGQSKAYQVDEYLAIQAEKLQQGGTIASVELGYIQRAMEAVRRILRKLGFKVRMTDLEVRRLLADANAALGESVTDVDGKTTETEEAPPIEETEDVRFEIAEDYQPQKTGKGFKLFDMVGGKLFPLFIGSNRETPVGVWLKAENLPTKGFAKRPGWHIGSTTPDAPWLKGDNGTDVGTYRSKRVGGTRVWAEVEYPMDVDYQPQADKAPTKDLPDTIPDDGYYLFKEGQRGTWVVSGALKVNRILPNEEIAGILEQQGYDQVSAFEPYRNAIIKRKETIAKKNASKDIRFQKDLSRAEYAEVYDRYHNTDQWLKAPNGEWSNLNEQQWVTVRTPSFLNWFGDWMNDPENASKVVDENGEPKVVYHGSSAEIEKITIPERGNLGIIYLTDSRLVADGYSLLGANRYKGEIMESGEALDVAEYKKDEILDERYPNVMPLFLNARNITNVEHVNDIIDVFGLEKIFNVLENDGDLVEFLGIDYDDLGLDKVDSATLKKYIEQTYTDDYVRENIPFDGFSLANASEQFRVLAISDNLLSEYMKRKGSDVILIPDDPENSGNTYVPSNVSQIKSAIGNIGTFDEGDSDIRFEQKDKRYFDALERGDEEAARRIVDEVAKQKGYISNNDFRMNHKAPNSHDGFSARLDQLDESGLLPKGFWEHPNWFTSDDREMQSITWEAVRGLFEASQKSGLKKDADKIWKRYKAGEITQAQAQAEIIELSGDITAPSWAASEYTETIQRTYSGPPQQAIDARGDIGRSKPKGKLALEVAPDPNNKELTAEWSSLAYNDKAEITSTIIEKIIPEALKELGVGGETISMIGGYEGATNPSIGLVLEREGLLLSAAKLLGYALSQDSMAIISEKEVLGTSPVDAVVITLPEGYGATEIEALYKRIYELKDNGSHLADGHTTANGFMTILNFSGMDIQEFARLIYKHLNGEFETRWIGLFSALIKKEEYQDVPGTDKTRRAAGWAPVQGRSNRLRDEASFLLQQEISRRKNRVQGRSEEGSQGTEDLSTTRFELSESGTAAGLDGSETKPRPISEKYMQRHRTQVQAAMKRGLTVPDRVLEAYAGEEWADKELADRKLIRSFSWILPLAKDVNTPEELKALVEEELQKQGFDVLGPKTPEDIDFYKRLLELSSPTTKQMYIDSFMDIVNSDRNLRSLVQDISEARENWQGLGLPSFIWGLASKVGNGAQITDADLDMIRSYTINSREKMATAYYASRGDTAALSKMGSEDIVYGTEEPERRAINAALIKDPEVLRQMLDGTITYGRLVEYEEQLQQEMAVIEGENDDLQAEIDRLNKEIIERSEGNKQKLKDQAAADREKMKTAIKAENQRRRSELTELRKAYKKRMESAISQLRDKQKERDEVRMAREFVERVAARMRRPVPPQTTSYTVGRKMEALAEFVIPSKWYRMEKTEDGLHRAEPDSTRATALIYYLSDPADDVESFLQDIQRFKDLTFGDFTTDQIALLYGITEHIRERGRREMAAFLESQRMRRDVAVNKILAEVLGGEKAQVFENIGSIESDKEQKSGAVFNAQAMSLRPPRMILLMSGGKEGVMYDWYINKINEATDAEIRNYQRRMKAGQQKMKELGLTVGMLEKELTYNDVTMRTDDVLHLWIGMKNEKNRNAILYGNRIEIGVVSGLTSQLTENQKSWATYMLDDFEAEYDRLNQTFIADRNQDMGKEQNYFTMIRQDLDQMPLGDEFASQIAVRNAWRKGYPNKSFSKERIEIADEHQKPIRLGATQIWFEQESKQEHYIASAILAKDLQYISDNQVLRDGLKQRFGRRANSWLRKYVNDWANPTMYKSFDSVTRWMGVVRNNMAVAYLGFNLLTVLKQAPSLAFYLKGANPVNLLAAASEMVLHPFETIRFVESMDPQIAARSYDRLTEELKGYDPNKAVRAARKVGQVSMKPIMWMDKAMVTIGWLGVYKNQIAKGASELEAAREAQKVTLDTQPAGRPKDVAEMYRSNELANWFTMFSNQLNQIWNMYTFDIPNAIKEREAAKLAGILAGIGVSGIAIAYLSGWRAPEDPEDLPAEAAVELFKNFLSVVPFLGNGLKSGYDKFYGAGLDPFPIAYTAGKLMADITGDPEKIGPDIASLVEDLAILTGLPVTGTKRLVNVGRYQHLNELLGYGFAQYTR